MKQLLLLIIAIFTVSFLSVSCEDSNVEDDVQSGVTPDSGYEEDLSYAPELIAVSPGYERGEFSLNLNSDGRTIQKYLLYWDNGKEMKEVEVTSTSDDITDILDIAEGDYTFYVKALDAEDKISAASNTLSVSIYGETLKSSLPARYIESGAFDNKKSYILTWAENEIEGMATTEVTYTPYLGEETTLSCDASESSLSLPNAQDEAEITITTTYLPYDNALDEITASATTVIGEDRTFVTVSSLVDLKEYLALSNQSITLAPGVYEVTVEDATSQIHSTYSMGSGYDTDYVIILVTGSNNYCNFAGVTIENATGVANAHGTGGELNIVRTIGNNNVIKGLTIKDIGDELDYPGPGYTNIVMDGEYNRIEEFSVYSTGSYPYGYGELFGKGGTQTIKHYKHCCCLVRGNFNHVKNCYMLHRAYGHIIFMQAATSPTIEGCYVEGEMGFTNDVLAEYGTGSAADLVNFETYWGYYVPADYAMSLCEEGIRAYDAGTTIVNGVITTGLAASNVTVKDCTVVKARGGVTLAHATGTSWVENTTTIDCNQGFSVRSSSTIKNCSTTVKYGPAFKVAYSYYSGITADITILAHEGETVNGSGQMACIGGSSHNLTFKKGDGLVADPDYQIYVGGDIRTIDLLYEDDNYSAKNNTIVNETGYPIIFDDNSSGNNVTTNGTYEDYGSDNVVTAL